MAWHGPHGLPKRPDPDPWVSWIALAGLAVVFAIAIWAAGFLP